MTDILEGFRIALGNARNANTMPAAATVTYVSATVSAKRPQRSQ